MHPSNPDKTIIMIAAIGPNNEIGCKNKLLFNIKADMKKFKEETMGCTVIMGRKTFESLPKGPLPGRLNIVISNEPEWRDKAVETYDRIVVSDSIEHAIEYANTNKVFIIGGGQIYKLALPYADYLMLTEINQTPEECDTWFPEFNKSAIDFPYVQSTIHKDLDTGIIYKNSLYMRNVNM